MNVAVQKLVVRNFRTTFRFLKFLKRNLPSEKWKTAIFNVFRTLNTPCLFIFIFEAYSLTFTISSKLSKKCIFIDVVVFGKKLQIFSILWTLESFTTRGRNPDVYKIISPKSVFPKRSKTTDIFKIQQDISGSRGSKQKLTFSHVLKKKFRFFKGKSPQHKVMPQKPWINFLIILEMNSETENPKTAIYVLFEL